MSMWKRTMDYLGLGPDDAYDDYDDYDEPEPAPRPRRASHEPEPGRVVGIPSTRPRVSCARCRRARRSRRATSIRRRRVASRPPTSRVSSPARAAAAA